jgi:RecA-family ATPase
MLKKKVEVTQKEVTTIQGTGQLYPETQSTLTEKEDNTVNAYQRDKRLISVRELFKKEVDEQQFIWGEFIPTESICLLCGPSDGGKSMLARQLCVAISKGDTHFLSKELKTKYKRSIYVSTEDSLQDWAFKMKKMQLSEADREELGDKMLIVTDYEKIHSILEKELLINPVDLVVMDVFADSFTGDLNSTSNVRNYLKPFKKMAEKFGCSILFIHHLSKKGESNSTPNKHNVLGAMGIESSMRSVFELRKDSQDGNIKYLSITKGNYVSEAEKKKVLKIFQMENFTFISDSKICSAPVIVKDNLHKEIEELILTGISGRKMVSLLQTKGFKVGKSRVADIVREIKSNKKLST